MRQMSSRHSTQATSRNTEVIYQAMYVGIAFEWYISTHMLMLLCCRSQLAASPPTYTPDNNNPLRATSLPQRTVHMFMILLPPTLHSPYSPMHGNRRIFMRSMMSRLWGLLCLLTPECRITSATLNCKSVIPPPSGAANNFPN